MDDDSIDLCPVVEEVAAPKTGTGALSPGMAEPPQKSIVRVAHTINPQVFNTEMHKQWHHQVSAPPAPRVSHVLGFNKRAAEDRADPEAKRPLGGSLVPTATPLPEEEDPILASTENIPEAHRPRLNPASPVVFQHPASAKDYQGRSWLQAATIVKRSGRCILPTHRTWADDKAHPGGVQCLRWLRPEGRPLLLSGGVDGVVRLWHMAGAYAERRVDPVMSYQGHHRGLRDVQGSASTGRMFTASYDRFVREWDIETGRVVRSYTTGAVPMCLTLEQNGEGPLLLVGGGDHTITKWDTRSPQGSAVHQYKGHTGTVNAVLYVEGGRRIVSCADDKTLRMFDAAGPTQVKVVTDPDMHSLVCLKAHPYQPSFLAQSMDNQILTYSCKGGRLRLETDRMTYKGHIVSGFGVEAAYSCDGKYISSGDAEGKMYVWDQSSYTIVKKWKAHDSGAVLLSHAWFPGLTSTIVTGSWDGSIRLWQ